jgi:predicted ATP-grasp superfamily ATP-dependent carboligase
MTRILVYEPLSAGAPDTRGNPAQADLLAAGRAMRDAIACDLARLHGVITTVAVGEQEAGHPGPRLRTVASHPDEGAVEFVRREVPLHDLCWIVAPETEGLLARLHDAIGAAHWIGCSAAALRIGSSKRATCAALARAGIRTPLAFAGRHRGPWIVKPDDGAGSVATRVHATHAAAQADWRERQRTGHGAIAEPFVAGDALSIAMIVGPVLARPVAVNRQRLHIDESGWLHDLGVQPAAIASSDPRAPALRALAQRVAAAMPGLRGYVGIDVVWNEGVGPVVIEVNPRVTCAYVGLSALLGRNLAADILAAHACAQQPEEAVHAGA